MIKIHMYLHSCREFFYVCAMSDITLVLVLYVKETEDKNNFHAAIDRDLQRQD